VTLFLKEKGGMGAGDEEHYQRPVTVRCRKERGGEKKGGATIIFRERRRISEIKRGKKGVTSLQAFDRGGGGV